MVKTPDLSFEFRFVLSYFQSSRDINVAGFGGHIAISGYRSSLVVAITWRHFIELSMVESPDLTLEFRRCLSQFHRYKYFRFRHAFPVVGQNLSESPIGTLSSNSPWSKTPSLPLEF